MDAPAPPGPEALPGLPQFPRDFPDRAFKELMTDTRNLQDLTEVVAPDYAHCLDCLNAVIVPNEILVSEVPDSPKSISDIVYDVPIRDGQGMNFPMCVKVVEHQSKPESDVIFRSFWVVSSKWQRRKQDWERGQTPGSFSLTPGTAIIVYTGSDSWNGPRTISQLIQGPQPLIAKSPRWEPEFLEVRRYTAEQLLKMDQRLFQSLAVVRGQNEPPGVFSSIFTDAFQALTSLRRENRGRWIGLARFVLSWGLAKRRSAEHEGLRRLARKVYRSHQAQQEIQQMMDTIIDAEFMKGFLQGREQERMESRLAIRREYLLLTLSQKFPAHMNAATAQRIGSADDPDVLKQWFEAALTAKSWKQFVKAAGWPPSA